jgi:hypothetical protein
MQPEIVNRGFLTFLHSFDPLGLCLFTLVKENFFIASTTPEIDTQSAHYQKVATYLNCILTQDQNFQRLPHFLDIEDYAIAA